MKMMCADVKKRGCQNEKMIDIDVNKRGCEDDKVICADVKMRGCEGEKMTEGSLEVKLPTVWTDGQTQTGKKSDTEKVRREKTSDGEHQRGRKSEKREDGGARR